MVFYLLIMMIAVSCKKTQNNREQTNGELVICALRKDGFLEATVPLFEEKFGVKCVVREAEAVDEKWLEECDVIVGVTEDFIYDCREALLPYVSVNDKYLIERYRNTEGYSTAYMLDGSCLIANSSLVEKSELKGYRDLLKPRFQGQIAVGNPITSASAFSHLTSLLTAMGGAESDEAWEFISKLHLQVGETVSDSVKMYDDVAAGRMMVGLASEAPAISMIDSGADFFLVYPEEGTSYQAVRACVLKKSANPEYAKHFMDFISGREMQKIYAEKLLKRVVYNGITGSEHLLPTDRIPVNIEDIEYIKQNKMKIIQKYSDYAGMSDN